MSGFPVTDGIVTLLSPPDGYIVDFDHPQRQANLQTYWCFGVGNILALLFLLQRLYTKIALSNGLQLDDGSWFTSTGTQILVIYMFASGVGGVHAWEISLQDFNSFLLYVYIASWIYVICGSFAKLALLVFCLRLSQLRWFRRLVWIAIAFISSYSIGIFFSLIFACDPIRKSWDVSTTGTCVSGPALYIATAVANILSDVILFLLPMPLILGLQLRKVQKIGVLVVFTIGSVTVVTSIVRCAILPEMLTSDDLSWAISFASMWIVIEANLLVICGAMTTLRKFFRHIAPTIVGSSRSRSGETRAIPSEQYGQHSGKLSRRQDRYAKFSDDTEMHPIQGINSAFNTAADAERLEGNNWDSRADTDSEKAIVQKLGASRSSANGHLKPAWRGNS